MKKFFKIVAIIIISLLAIMIIVPFAFRGKIKEVALQQANQQLNANVNFESLSISLFKHFPKASIIIEGVDVVGKNQFEGDTLAHIGQTVATVDVMSLFGSKYVIENIEISNSSVNAIVDTLGQANWDIMISGEKTAEEGSESSSDAAFNISLKVFKIDNVTLSYSDFSSKMFVRAENFSLKMKGDLSAERAEIDLKSEIERFIFSQGGIKLINGVTLKADINLDADLKNSIFTLKDNKISLNAIELSADGSVKTADDILDLDITLATNKISFKELLSLVPAVYAKDFDKLKADGSVALSGFVKGVVAESSFPDFNFDLNVSDGKIKYEDLPKSIDNINIKASAKCSGGDIDNSVITVAPFSFVIANNPFSLSITVTNPTTDPFISAAAKGDLNLAMIKEVYPLEKGTTLNGHIKADLSFESRMSTIEKEDYENVVANGSISVSGAALTLPDMPQMTIVKSLFTFSPKYLNLDRTEVKIGGSDITTSARVENYIGYVLKGKTLKGAFDITSNYLNVNQLMGTASADSTVVSNSSSQTEEMVGAIEIPKNMDLKLTTSLKKVIYDKLEIDNIEGAIAVKDGEADLRNLSMNVVGGRVVVSGLYSSAEDAKRPNFKGAVRMDSLSFQKSFSAFDMMRSFAPIFENLNGKYSGSLDLSMRMDSTMTADLNSLSADGVLTTKGVNISGIKAFDIIADLVKYPKLKNLDVEDLRVHFVVKDGKVIAKPFDLKVGNININLSGTTSLDQSIDYRAKVKLPGSGAITTFDLLISGTFSSPKVALDTKSLGNQIINSAKDKLTDKIGNKLGVDLQDKQKQKDAIVGAAKDAGDKLIAEAKKQSDKLLSEAGNKMVAKIAAKEAGKLLVREAEKQAAKLLEKAESEANKLDSAK